MDNNNQNANSASFIRQVLTSEVKLVAGILLFAGGIIAPFYGIKQDVALIQKDITVIQMNHLKHIEDISNEVKEMRLRSLQQEKEIIELQKQLITVLNKR